MSAHTLAAAVTILLVLRLGIRIGMPYEKKPRTAEQGILMLLAVPYFVALVWLLVKVLL